MAFLGQLLHPFGAYGALRDQLGSIRGVYLRGNDVEKKEDFRKRELVVLIHGFFQTRNIWEVMEDRLRFDGFGVVSFNLGGLLSRFNTHPVDTSARLVADKIEGLAAKHGVDAVHLVGHSKGGIIARRYVQHFGGDKRVKSVITLGTPHHGTPTALIGLPMFGFGLLSTTPMDLLPVSPLIQRLSRDTFPAHVPLTSVYSKEDLVCPWWCARLRPRKGESSIRNIQVRGLGHSELCWDAGVYRILRQRLEQAATLFDERQGGAHGIHPTPP
jgi:triacylglycerol lipase